MARRVPVTAHAERAIKLAMVAHFWGLIPIPLEYKRPNSAGWPKVQYNEALEKFQQRVSGLRQIDQERLNVGVLTGLVAAPNPIVVVDIDKKNGGLERWNRWRAAPDQIVPVTFTVQTGGGGLHLYFKYRSGLPKIVSQAFGIDYQSDGGQVVFPGSIHEKTVELYRVSDGFYYDEDDELQPIFADMPDWLFVKLSQVRLGTTD